ncbi:phenylacetate--CoA ligase family protein [Actinoplanes xinjiangensis]|uniref:Phenylacetate-CoA ligase n=1 Tax=Actinoplanes xinjiangensis TaxID=512350 RepID=A0A316FCC2_9ACTN|nr:phenylacetate--CoA ligase family protein [Actinoplanes xinjiangensis]PWK45139.1 phenylacetate-CoA ligase [Actinoplanes xinjiangensis]GIF41526.1 phenylacetate--CoA ligase [Actinoplanes xinjiangensis]
MQVLELFRDAAETVPAYALFLRERGVDPASVTDPAQIPLMTKQDYHQRFDLPQRCRDGRLDAAATVAVSSGSSGRPTVWPRTVADEVPVTARFAQVFRDGFRAGERSTLAVVCFALGNWVGGMYTVAACRQLPVTVAAPGNDIEEILRVVGELGGHFEQTVLLGYPPFVKNVIDAGVARGVDWASLRIKLVLAGEVFSEQWRDLVAARAGIDDPETGVASLYGTADAGVLGNETPLSVRVRRFLSRRPEVAAELFGESRLPTLVQYDPAARLFETAPDGTLVFTADGTVPLVRYHIADDGGVLPKADLIAVCREHGFDPGDGPDLPFVYVFGRSLFTVSYFGANVYPENVTVGLERPDISAWSTGRFVLSTIEDDDRDRHLSVVVELAPGAEGTPERERMAAESIRAELLRLNSEFAHYVPTGNRTPRVELRPADDPEFFPRGVKHRYTRR